MHARRRPGRPPGTHFSGTRFFAAARRWDAALVTEALRAHPELLASTDRAGRCALHVCAATPAERAPRPVSASIATARALLAGGADIDAVHHIPDSGEVFPATPLWHAIARGRNRSLARFLLRQGANPNYCLWAVVWNDDVVTARLLHSHQADLDLTFHDETPLLYATRLRRTRIARWLLAHGANPNIGDADGITPLAVAIKRRHSLGEIEQLLAHGADQHTAGRDGKCPRSLAAPSAAGVRQLLDRYDRAPSNGS